MPRSAEEFSELGKVGVHARLATEDPVRMTEAARRGRWQKYLDRADPKGILDPEERVRRATALRDQDLARMRLARATAERRKAERAAKGARITVHCAAGHPVKTRVRGGNTTCLQCGRNVYVRPDGTTCHEPAA